MDIQLHDVADSRVEPDDFECDYEGHKKLPGDAIHLFEASIHRFLRPEFDSISNKLIGINPPESKLMHLSLGLGSKAESGETSNPPMQSSTFCCLINGGKTYLFHDTPGNFLKLLTFSENILPSAFVMQQAKLLPFSSTLISSF
jgi:hypothetical protein